MQNETYLRELNTQSQTVNNAIITLGDTDDSGKGRHFKSRFIQPGVAGYPGQFGNVLITKQTLDKFIQSMVGVPVIIQHKNITAKNADDERVGVVNSVWYDENDGWYWCDGIIWDDTAINLIQDQGWSVSCSYDVKLADNAGGSENNIKYDMEFLDGVFTHLALVNNPRYERATIVFNSKDVPFFIVYNDSDRDLNDTSTDRWITIHPNGEDAKGRAVLIPEGKTVSEVMKEKYAKWATESKAQQKLFDPKEYKTGISDYKLAKETKKAVDKYGEYADREQIEEHLKEKFGYKDFLAKDKEDDKKEDKKARTFVDKSGKEHSLKDLVEKGYNPVRYSSSLWENKPSYGIGDGKTEYKISEDEYKEALEHKKNKKSADLQKAKEKSKDLTDYIKWQYNADIEPHITRRVGEKTLVDWDKLPRETQSALKRLDFDGKIKLEEYSGFEKSIDVTDKKIFENLDKHKKDADKKTLAKTSDDFKKNILATEIKKYQPTKSIQDWGSLRGQQQGKRAGKMVKGSMRDVSLQGKKEYTNILGGLPEYDEIKEGYFGSDIQGEREKVAYLKAREAGYNKEDSFLFAYSLDDKENLLYKKLKENKANNSLSFKERFIDTFYQALAEVIVGDKELKTEKEL